LLGDVCAAFRELDETRQGLVRGHLTTAWPVEDAAAAGVAARLTERLGSRVVLARAADPGLLGGFRVQVRDTVYDASVAARLRLARAALMGARAQGVTRGG
jgi:F0F1-type ATP synthase delta subunit